MLKILMTTFLLISCAQGKSEGLNIPIGWRLPTEAETTQDWRINDKNKFLMKNADFNGDGIIDTVQVYVKNTGNVFAIFAHVSNHKAIKTIKLEEYEIQQLENIGVNLIKSGKYLTACGKGYYTCDTKNSKYVVVKNTGIDIFSWEQGNSILNWDSHTQMFLETPMSD